jgi:microsomal epoxide hydrolase
MPHRLITTTALLLAVCMTRAGQAREVDVDVGRDVRIHATVSEFAQTERPALVFIPGWRFTHSIWSNEIATFSKDRQVIAIDPRSQGASTITAEGDTPEQRAQDLHALLASIGVRDVVLVGWSQGVQDVAAYILRYGTDDIAGVVLVDSTISQGAQAIAKAPASASTQLNLLPMYLDDPRAYTEGMMRAVITRQLAPAQRTALVNAALQTPPAIGATMLIADMFGTDRSAAIAKIDKPTMIVASSRSLELDAQKAMASQIPGAEVHVINGAAHAVFVDQPHAFDTLLSRFLTRVSSSVRMPTR